MKYTHLIMMLCLLMVFTTAGIAKAQTDTTDNKKSKLSESVDTADNKKSKLPEPDVRHEIALYGGGGMSPLNYSLDKSGSKTDGAGGISGHAGLAYTWNLNDYFGVVTGLELASYGAKSSYDVIEGGKRFEGDKSHDFYYGIYDFIEEQSITLISIPVMFQYSTPLPGTMKFYVSGGVKMGLPVSATAIQFSNRITTEDFNDEDHVTYDEVPQMSLYTDHPDNKSGNISVDIDTKVVSIVASLETGVRFILTEKIMLYTSAYLDYGLNNIRSTKNKDIITYLYNESGATSTLKYSSILNTPHVDKMKIFGAGLRVRVSFGWN
jgi:hypothetical protein